MRGLLLLFVRIASVSSFLALALALAAQQAGAQDLRASSPSELRARYATLRPHLETNSLTGPLYIDSVEGSRSSQGDVYAVVAYPFATVRAALNDPSRWCDVMILHLNTKLCRSRTQAGAVELELRVGRKYDQPLPETKQVLFSWSASVATPEYMQMQLDAPQGPFDTHDYRILFEAVSLDSDRTFVHLGYSVAYGTASRLALRLYLATIARDKVGFSAAASRPAEGPGYVAGVRGMVERNTMRYYLAIEAYLGALSAPPAEQLEKRLQAWFDATEKYPRQLREIDRVAYLQMKRSEYRRQQAAK